MNTFDVLFDMRHAEHAQAQKKNKILLEFFH
jgi:hypothetical protein